MPRFALCSGVHEVAAAQNSVFSGHRSSVVEHSLGKGEVKGSSPFGGSSNPHSPKVIGPGLQAQVLVLSGDGLGSGALATPGVRIVTVA